MDMIFNFFLVTLLLAGAFAILMVFVSMEQAKQRELRIRALQIADIDQMPGLEFEHYVAKLLERQGFRTQVTA